MIIGYFSDIAMTQQAKPGYSSVFFWDGWHMVKMAGDVQKIKK
jgi:hypothetical protein